MAKKWNAAVVVDRLRECLGPRGIDIVHPFAVQRYNQNVVGMGKAEWAMPEGSHPSTLAVLIGNTKQIWGPLCEHMATAHRDDWHNEKKCPAPVDAYVEQVVAEALAFPARGGTAEAELADSEGAPSVLEARFSHGHGKRFVHMQRACAVSGFAHFSPHCFLNVHAVYGPWISLRSVVVLDVPMDNDLAVPPEPKNPYPEADDAIAAQLAKLTAKGAKPDWKAWVALRDLATSEPARVHRFSEPQIRYHYIYDRKAFFEGEK